MNSITQHIRPANSTDAAMLQVLVRDCVGAMRAAGIEQWDEVYPNAKTIARDMEAGTLHILEDGKSIVAIITIDQYLDPLWQGMDWRQRTSSSRASAYGASIAAGARSGEDADAARGDGGA